VSEQEAPRGRFVAGNIVVIAASALAAIGARTTWFTLTFPGRRFVMPAGGKQGVGHFPGLDTTLSGQEVAGDVVGFALLMLVLAALAVLARPKIRVALLGLVAMCAVAIVSLASTVSRADAVAAARAGGVAVSTGAKVQTRAGRPVAQAGAVIAGLAALQSIPGALRTRAVHMPESGPDDVED
jgi:hypothetical protein